MLKKQTLIRVLLGLLLLAGGTHLYFRFRVAPALLLPEIQMQTLNGESVTATQGQATILIFFATWCPDCRRELPVLSSLENRITDLNIRIILVSDESVEKLQNLRLEFFPFLLSSYLLIRRSLWWLSIPFCLSE